MTTKKAGKLRGFTLMELMLSLVIMGISVSAIGTVIVDSQNGWSRLYNRVNSPVVTDGYVAKKKFDAVVRKASSELINLSSDKSQVEVYYYLSDSSTNPDGYTRFFTSGDDLMIEYGTLNPKVTTDYETICSNVSSCKFEQSGRSIQMFLKLDNGTQSNTIITSAVLNN
jgi:prepilin-type N-terminal cleavage/methylation domain-containing protein